MKIYDCFMFFDEDMLLDLRLNIMDKYVDKFVITEANYMHSGRPKKLNFNINKFPKYKDKIIYKVVDKQPTNIVPLDKNDDEKTREVKLINNSNKREHYQREMIGECLNDADYDDFIIIGDVDEIPNLDAIILKKIKKKLVCFKQKMFFYKFNLLYEKIAWYGSRVCKKKHLISPQWLRDTKHKKYPLWRIDIMFSKTKYNNIHHVENGGWHFTNIKTPEDIKNKFSNFLHHQEFESSGLKLDDIKKMVNMKKVIYDHSVDQRGYKWKGDANLKKVPLSEMPNYLSENYKKYSDWLET